MQGVERLQCLRMKQRRAEAWSKWRGLVADQNASGQSVAKFCSERGLSSAQLFAWKKRLREAEATRFVALELAPVTEAQWPAAVTRSRAIEVRLHVGNGKRGSIQGLQWSPAAGQERTDRCSNSPLYRL